MKFFDCAVCFNSAITRKGAMALPKVIQTISISLLSYFQAKTPPLIPVLQNDAIIVEF